MARMMTFVVIAFVLSIILNITNLEPSNSSILTTTGFQDVKDSNFGITSFSQFYSVLFGGLGLTGILIGLGTGIVIGFLTRGTPENYIVLGFITGTLGLFIGSFYSAIILSGNYSQDFIRIPITIICGVFAIGYIMTMVEFFRGNV